MISKIDARNDYISRYGNANQIAILKGPDNSLIVCKMVKKSYSPPFARYYPDGSKERGILRHRHVWESREVLHDE